MFEHKSLMIYKISIGKFERMERRNRIQLLEHAVIGRTRSCKKTSIGQRRINKERERERKGNKCKE